MSEKVLVRDGKRAIRADLNTRQQPPDLLDDDANREVPHLSIIAHQCLL